jgi:hypothetical protein
VPCCRTIRAIGGSIPLARALMRQCWKELINPPPDNEAAWILTAPDPTLQAVADCINKKAGGMR